MGLREKYDALLSENKSLRATNETLQRQHQLDMSDLVRLRRLVDFLMESQG